MIKINSTRIQTDIYPDNTPVVDLEEAWRFSSPYDDKRTMTLQPNSMQEFVTGMLIAESFAERNKPIHTLIIPCIPGARQDRLKNEGDWLFTLKWVARQINDQQFNSVITVDPHSLATTALIDRLRVAPINVANLFRSYKPVTYDGIIAPDIGAEKRASEVARQFGIPMHQAKKVRDPATNKLSEFKIIDDLDAGRHYLVVDDLCDAGGTFLGLADEISKQSATADLFVTHGLFTRGTSGLLRKYDRLFTTDTIDMYPERVTVFHIMRGLYAYV